MDPSRGENRHANGDKTTQEGVLKQTLCADAPATTGVEAISGIWCMDPSRGENRHANGDKTTQEGVLKQTLSADAPVTAGVEAINGMLCKDSLCGKSRYGEKNTVQEERLVQTLRADAPARAREEATITIDDPPELTYRDTDVHEDDDASDLANNMNPMEIYNANGESTAQRADAPELCLNPTDITYVQKMRNEALSRRKFARYKTKLNGRMKKTKVHQTNVYQSADTPVNADVTVVEQDTHFLYSQSLNRKRLK
jgi:hypothetical protein